jgi:hypothetical protein
MRLMVSRKIRSVVVSTTAERGGAGGGVERLERGRTGGEVGQVSAVAP